MAQKTTVEVKAGYSTATLLFITFLVLKLTHVINWSWWWITAPIWGPLALLALFGLILFIGLLITKEI